MVNNGKPGGWRPKIRPYYRHVPELDGARFVFIEAPLWAAGLKWAKTRPYRSKHEWDLEVLFGVTVLANTRSLVIRKATDKSVMLTATTKYLKSVGKTRGDLVRISMNDIRRAERYVGWRNARLY